MDQIQSEIHRELERRFPPEFRNRIDQVVVFEPLTKDEVRAIAVKYIDATVATLKRLGKTVTIEPEALERLVADGYSPAYGARFLKRVIDDKVKLPISQRWKDASRFHVTLSDGEISIHATDAAVVDAADLEAIAS